MKTFLGILGKQNEIDAYTLDKIRSVASRSLACAPGSYKTELWQSPSKRAALFAFTNEPLAESSSSLWSTASGAFTISGYINGSLDKLADTLLNKCGDEAMRQAAIRQTSGLYSACLADGALDAITILNTITRIEPVYWVENSKHIIVSTRALLAHLLSQDSETPNYDIMNLGYFINSGYYNAEATPYKGVKVLSPNSVLRINSQGAKVQQLDSLRAEEILIEPDAGFYDELTDTFLEAFLPLKRHDAQIIADLTGGRDSRLIAAALKYINVNFMTSTNGFPEHPDVVIASKIASALNIPHTVNVPQIQKTSSGEYLAVDISKRTKDTLFITDGMLSAYENMTRCSQFLPDIISVKGNGGELLRGGFASSIKKYDIRNIRELCFKKFFYYEAFLCDEPKRLYFDALSSWLDAQPHWFTAADIGAGYFLDYDCGRWSASERAGTTSGFYVHQPSFDNKLVNMIRRIHCNYLVKEELVYNLLKRLAPELIDIPFDNTRWRFEADGPRKGEESLWIKRAPIRGTANTKSSFNWRRTCLSDMKDIFYDQIFNSPEAEAVFEIVKRGAVQKLFDSPPQLQDGSNIDGFLWNLYSACVLLSNQWLSDTGKSTIAKIKIPN